MTSSLLIGLVWNIAIFRSSDRHASVGAAALRHALALLRAYAGQSRWGVGELDQITLTLKYYRERNRSNVKLEDQARHG
ncbi:MAG: hypothetical protein ACJ8G3_19145 [Burkholderiaceae bacterium]